MARSFLTTTTTTKTRCLDHQVPLHKLSQSLAALAMRLVKGKLDSAHKTTSAAWLTSRSYGGWLVCSPFTLPYSWGCVIRGRENRVESSSLLCLCWAKQAQHSSSLRSAALALCMHARKKLAHHSQRTYSLHALSVCLRFTLVFLDFGCTKSWNPNRHSRCANWWFILQGNLRSSLLLNRKSTNKSKVLSEREKVIQFVCKPCWNNFRNFFF